MYLSYGNIEQYESGHLWRTPHIRVKGPDRRPFFSFRLDIGVLKFQSWEQICLHNQTWKEQDKFTNKKFTTEQTYEGHEIQTYSVKVHENSKMFKQDCCWNYVKHQ